MFGRGLGGSRGPLIGAAARTAAVAGIASVMSRRLARRRMERQAAQSAVPEAREAGEPTGGPDTEATTELAELDDRAISRLERLAELHTQGVLTDQEFATAKHRVIGD